MSQAALASDRHIIWSDISLNPDDWRDDYKDFLEINGLDDDPNNENELYQWMVETNADYLDDERMNLNIQIFSAYFGSSRHWAVERSFQRIQGNRVWQYQRLPLHWNGYVRMVCG